MDCVTNPVEGTAKACQPTDNPLILQVNDHGLSGQTAPLKSSADAGLGARESAREVAAGTIPTLVIDHSPVPAHGPGQAQAAVPEHHWYTGALAVAEDVAIGAVEEVVEHPLRVAAYFAVGAGTAAIASVVAAPVAIGATALGLGWGAYQIYEHAPGWIHSAEDLQHPEQHTAAELARANQTWKDFGGGVTDLAAAVGGGIAYRAAASAISEALTDSADAHPVKAAAASNASNTDGGASNHAAASGAAGTPTDGGASSQTVTPPGDGGASTHGAIVPGHESAVAHAAAAGQVEQPTGTPDLVGETAPLAPESATPAESTLGAAAKPVEVGPVVNLDTPAVNTSEPALRAALRTAIAEAQSDDSPLTFKVDTTVQLTDAAGNPIKLTQADVLYQELQAANPENHFVFSKPDLQPGDVGYTEMHAPSVMQDGLQISTKENAITLAKGATLPDGTTLPDGSKFAVGTTYDGNVVKSALPGGKVWAIKPDGSYVQVADAGEATPIPADALSTDPKMLGQVVNAKTPDGFQNRIIIRTDAKAFAPDGKPLLDAYPSGGASFEAAYKPGSEPGMWAPKPKFADHFLLPNNVTVEANTNWGASTASGVKGDYFMKSGFADAWEATAKNYFGATNDAQSAAELLRIRIALGLPTK